MWWRIRLSCHYFIFVCFLFLIQINGIYGTIESNGPIVVTCEDTSINWNESYSIADEVFNCSITSGVDLEIVRGNTDNILRVDNSIEGVGVVYFSKIPSYENPNYVAFVLSMGVKHDTYSFVTIINHDSDNNFPTFFPTSVQVSVKENTWDDCIASFNVTDFDASPEFGIESVTYSFKKPTGDYDGTFNFSENLIDKRTAIDVGLKEQLDYETSVFYNFVLIAVDGGGLEGEASVIVNVIDQEDMPPQFTKIAPYTGIQEDANIGISVFQIQAVDGDRGINHPIRYAFVSGNIDDDFYIDEIEGIVYVQHTLDADNKTRPTIYSFNISATEQNVTVITAPHISYTTCLVDVIDIDDNPPVFSALQYNSSINELSPVGTETMFHNGHFITVTDIDMGENARFTVKLQDESGIFSISPMEGEKQETFSIVVSNPQRLDCDVLQSVIINLVATDEKNSTFKDYASVFVAVNDINNHWPEFDKDQYEVKIKETTMSGIEVLTVKAVDKDINENYNRVYYRIENSAAPMFAIDRNNGTIQVAIDMKLDRDVTPNYTLTVKADDGTIHPEATNDTCSVVVILIDVNNKPPQFDDDGIFSMSIEENTINDGNPIFKLNASDPDLNHKLQYSIDYDKSIAKDNDDQIIPHMDLKNFTVDKDSGYIVLKCSLDREVTKTIILSVVVKDINTEVGVDSATGTLTVNVLDVNDNAPVFNALFYNGSIKENMVDALVNNVNGSGILKIRATDADIVYNVVTLSVIYNDHSNNTVSIDTLTGELTVGDQSFDYEQFHFVNLIVEAADNGGKDQLSANTTVDIAVIDQNDNSPEFEQPSYTFFIPENNCTFLNESRVKANDRDSGAYGVVTYIVLAREAIFLSFFNISDTTGIVYETDPAGVDYEQIQQLQASVFAYDNFYSKDGSPINSDKTEVTIKIIDENDNWPQFLNPGTTFNVKEDANIHTPLGYVKAKDDDLSPQFNTLQFSLLNESLFAIDEKTGQLSVVLSLIDLVGLHPLYTKVCDTGEPPNCNETFYFISVEDVNNHPPVIQQPPENFSVEIKEAFFKDDSIFSLNYTDADVEEVNKESSFNLSALCIQGATAGQKTSLFFISGSDMSEVYISGDLSRDDCFLYKLEILAWNINNPAMHSGIRTCFVVVQSSHHHPAQFPYGSQFKVNFTEEQAPGFPVYYPDQPFNPDDEGTGNVTSAFCFILGGPFADDFVMTDHVNCNFTTKLVLDRESISSYNDMHVILFASDVDVQPPRVDVYNSSDPAMLLAHIQLLDINDNPPQFNDTTFYGGVSSDTAVGTNFMNITAYDVDIIDQGKLQYSINGTPVFHNKGNLDNIHVNPFTVDSVTGQITLNYKFSSDQRGYIDFTVQVVDSDVSHIDQARVSVYVVSKDEKLICLALLSPDAFLSDYVDTFTKDFTNAITRGRVVLDAVQMHVDETGEQSTTLSDIYIHFIDEATNDVIDAGTASSIIDASLETLTPVYDKYHIHQVIGPTNNNSTPDIRLYTVTAVAIALGVVCLLIFSVCSYRGYRMKRQLKAATAVSFGSQHSGLNRDANVPNTNLHTGEGSNPVWHNSRAEEEENATHYENLSEGSCSSLQDIEDENVFEGGQNNPTFEERVENVFRNAYNKEYGQNEIYSDVLETDCDDQTFNHEIDANFSFGTKLDEYNI